MDTGFDAVKKHIFNADFRRSNADSRGLSRWGCLRESALEPRLFSFRYYIQHFHFRNTVCFFICLTLCFVSSGCDAVYRFLDKEGAEEKALVGEILPFEKNLVVEEIQTLLHLYGYNTGKIDGILGLRTRNAIEKFRADNGLEKGRVVDQATWEKLSVFKENGLVVDRQINVRLVQTLLKEAGFSTGKIDGKMGPRTIKSVKRFQEANELKVDGKVGYRTLGKLAAFIPAGPQIEH